MNGHCPKGFFRSPNQFVRLIASIACPLCILGCSTPSQRLYKAASEGNVKSAARILQAGFNPKDAGFHLRTAAYGGHTEFIKLLLDAGVDVNAGDRTALMAAARDGHFDTVCLLIERGADVNHQENARKIGDLNVIWKDGKQVAEFHETVLKGQGN